MIFGKPKIFHLPKESLELIREDIWAYLLLKGIMPHYYMKAFDYFVNNPKKYDGATIVKDIKNLHGIDLTALRHDYDYIISLPRYSGLKWLKAKFLFDWRYGQNIEELNSVIYPAYSRFIGLLLTTPFYWLYIKFKND